MKRNTTFLVIILLILTVNINNSTAAGYSSFSYTEKLETNEHNVKMPGCPSQVILTAPVEFTLADSQKKNK